MKYRLTLLTFHSNHFKSLFVKQNAISKNEMHEEGNAYIILKESLSAIPVDWSKNGFVYSTKELQA